MLVTLKEAQSACDGIGRRIFYAGNPILVGLVQNYLLWRKTEFAQVWSSSPPGEILPVGTGIVTTFDFLESTVANAIALDEKKIMSVCLAGKDLRA
ncbi:unnamed protein product [Orchesella dallaii]|uniref:Uncharacterized protein n=1 Tax=Orchesella dallaii TaxID=48710 RepID=A0ABP1QCI2_9HEXA